MINRIFIKEKYKKDLKAMNNNQLESKMNKMNKRMEMSHYLHMGIIHLNKDFRRKYSKIVCSFKNNERIK
jgi:ABC-type Na+ transport system ATPase subunit NatA